MLPVVDINYLAVLAAGVTSMIVGAAWYSPALFGKQWMKLIGLTEEDKKKTNLGQTYGTMFVLSLVLAYVMAHFVGYVGVTTIGEAVQFGFWIWLGFVFTTKGAQSVFVKQPLNLFGIDVGYHLVQMVVMAVILTVWM